MDFFELLPFIIAIGAFIISSLSKDKKKAVSQNSISESEAESEPDFNQIDTIDYDTELEEMLENEVIPDDIISGKYSKRARHTTDISESSIKDAILDADGKLVRKSKVTFNLKRAIIENEILNRKY